MQPNRRKHHRVTSRDLPCKLTMQDETAEVRIINESIEGIRVGDVKLNALERGEAVELEIDGEIIKGRARSVSKNKDETYQIGIQLEKSIKAGSNSSRLLGHFIRFHGHWVYCTILDNVSSNRAMIRLLDGKEFTISKNQIFQMTEEERRTMLTDKEELADTVSFYNLMAPYLHFPTVDSVIAQEFQQRV